MTADDLGIGPGATHVDLARAGAPEEAAATATVFLIAAVTAAGGEAVFTAEQVEAAEHGGNIVTIDEHEDGAHVLRVVSRVARDDPRVPPGGWVQSETGYAVHVEGVSHEGLVIVTHQLGEPGEHRADELVETFLARHVQADSVPLL